MVAVGPIAAGNAVVAAVAVLMLVVTWRSQSTSATGRSLVALFLAVAVWSAATALVHAAETFTARAFWVRAKYLGESIAPPLVFLFVATYVNRRRFHRPRRVAALFVVPVLTNGFLWAPDPVPTPRVHSVAPAPTPSGLDPTFHPWFFVHVGHSYLLVLAAIGLAGRAVWEGARAGSLFDQRLLVFVALLTPTVVNVPYALRVLPVDLTPAAFVVTGLALFVAIRDHRLLTIQPIARGVVMDTVDEGVVVLDTADRVVDVNAAAAETLALDDDPVGQPAAAVLGGLAPVVDPERTTATRSVTVDHGDDRRHFEVEVSPIRRGSTVIGRVVVFNDVTERVRRKRELEHQNERLEEFASVVSHDLRNPLAVLEGRLAMARETGADEHFEEMERSVERMDTLIEEVLTMARQGRAVADREPVDVGRVAADAWSTVDTADATLDLSVDRRAVADRDRLLRVFENLFRNSVDHGGDDVTVRVGDVDEGFFVADDGPGIPPEDRDRVFDRGYTTASDGTGFGLSIVRGAVEAHDWSIEAVDPEAGGVRFEVTGLESPSGRDVAAGSDPEHATPPG